MEFAKSMEWMWAEAEEEINCFITGLLPTGGLMVITGEPGVGKSWFAQQMGFELACGFRILGLFAAIMCKVIYFELEMRSPIARKRFRLPQWKEKYSSGKQNMGHYDNAVIQFDNQRSIENFKGIVTDFDAKVVIIDSYAMTLDDERDLKIQKQTIANYRAVAKEMKIGILFIQHLIKRPKSYDNKVKQWTQPPLGLDDIRGSKFLQYEVDTGLGLTQPRKDVRELAVLKHRFSEVELSAEPPLELRWNPTSGSPLWPIEYRLPVIMKILDERTSISFSELETILPNKENQETTGISRPTLRKDIDSLKDLGLVYIDEGGGKSNESVVHRI